MTYWDKDTIELVQNLNGKLKIDHSKWHKEKGNKYKRSAELISAGLCQLIICLLYTSPSPRDPQVSRMPSSA